MNADSYLRALRMWFGECAVAQRAERPKAGSSLLRPSMMAKFATTTVSLAGLMQPDSARKPRASVRTVTRREKSRVPTRLRRDPGLLLDY